MLSAFEITVSICSGIATIVALILMLVRPIRERILGTASIREGQRCMLRSDLLRIYYENHEQNSIREYEKTAFIQEYKAYKALGGNSFIDDCYNELRTWEVVR